MPLNLENIEQQVAKNLESQAPTAQPTTEVTLPTPADELSKLKDEVAQLRREQAAAKLDAENTASDLRIKAAQAIAHKPVPAVRSNVQQDLAFTKLRDPLGGNCYLKNLTPVQQLEAIGIFGTEQIPDKEVKKFLGRGSDSGAANALRRSSPERYSLLRAVAIARGIL